MPALKAPGFLAKYMVLVETEQKLLVMRPYQIYAVKAIDGFVRHNRGKGYILAYHW